MNEQFPALGYVAENDVTQTEVGFFGRAEIRTKYYSGTRVVYGTSLSAFYLWKYLRDAYCIL